MRYFIKLSYNGSAFNGWQRQLNAPSVQQEIETALETALKSKIEIVGCGRTDTGVHAKNFYAHFDFETSIQSSKLLNQLNGILPRSIAIHSIFDVDQETHARFSAVSRTYEYFIHFDRNPFLEQFSYQWYGELPDFDLLQQGSEYLKTITDFKAFSKSKTQVNNYNCELFEIYWAFAQKQLIFRVRANRFLRNMVRAMVGTLMDLGTGKIDFETFKTAVHSGDRSNLGTSFPACGLYLTHVEYPFEDFVL